MGLINTKTIIGKDGTEMILIPAGDFLMGCPEGEGEPHERPQHIVYLDAFYIDKYEVTNAQYQRFIDETGHRAPAYWNDNRFNAANYPVVGVSWFDAEAYCKWANKRLPTEAEWEKAARGTDGRKYPWGNEAPDAGGIWRANYAPEGNRAADGFEYTAPVGSFPGGASPYGVMDMAGNVLEWVTDWYSRDYYSISPKSNPKGPSSGRYRVHRGGSWDNIEINLRTVNRIRAGIYPVNRFNFLGFRCAKDITIAP
jgi:formylglycine-generating enzyme required for sulfatase activity